MTGLAPSTAPCQPGLVRRLAGRPTPTAVAVATLKWLLDTSEATLLGDVRAAAAAVGLPAAGASDVALGCRR